MTATVTQTHGLAFLRTNGYGTVALSPSGDHVAGSGKPLKGGHATATVTVERGGQVATTSIALHLEGGHQGH